MRTAILGGTFDPVHIGHLFMADEVLARLNYEQIRLVPARVPPHKRDAPGANAEHRLRMLELAVEGHDEFVVDRFEIDQDGVSYTVKTLEHLIDSGTVTGRPGLIIGEDLVSGFERWREADRVAELADIILVRRPGGDGERFGREHRSIENLMLEISSTQIRGRVREGLPYRYLVTPAVYDYIRRCGLYVDDEAGRQCEQAE
ncbi:MAG: nicotinate-nucleotide adenylyltransferase [Spirochaetota bacterium]